MSAFSDARKFEDLAFLDIVPFLESRAESVIDTNTVEGTVFTPGGMHINETGDGRLSKIGKLSKELQTNVGDFLVKYSDSETHTIEVKAEESCLYGNIFIETWSNRTHRTPGWICKLTCSRLFYFFCEERWLLSFDFERLRFWAFREGRMYDFKEKCQKKRNQLNDTWGHCVPVSVLVSEVKPKQFFFEGEYGNVSRQIP